MVGCCEFPVPIFFGSFDSFRTQKPALEKRVTAGSCRNREPQTFGAKQLEFIEKNFRVDQRVLHKFGGRLVLRIDP